MFTSLAWDSHPIDRANSMIQFPSILLVSALDGAPSWWYPAVRRMYEFHGLRNEGKQVISPIMAMLDSTIWYTCERVEMRPDLAWLDGMLEERRADEDW